MAPEHDDRLREPAGGDIRELPGRELPAARPAIEQLAAMGMPPWELQSFARRLAEAAERRGVPAARLREELLEGLERADALAQMEAALAARRAEMERIEAGIAAGREESQRLSGTLAGLRREQEHLEQLTPALRERAAADIKRLGNEAVVAIRDEAVALRREMESLLQQSLDVAKTAAAVDADIRSKEWLKRLLDLVEDGGDVRQTEARSLAHTLLSALARWIERHPSSAPPELEAELGQLIARVREWKG